MPTLDELEGLYDEKLTNEHGFHITKLINVGAPSYIWADNNSWGGAAKFNFKTWFHACLMTCLVGGGIGMVCSITAQGRCPCEPRIEHYGYLMI